MFRRALTSFTVGRDGRPDLHFTEGAAYDDNDPNFAAVMERFPERFTAPEDQKKGAGK